MREWHVTPQRPTISIADRLSVRRKRMRRVHGNLVSVPILAATLVVMCVLVSACTSASGQTGTVVGTVHGAANIGGQSPSSAQWRNLIATVELMSGRSVYGKVRSSADGRFHALLTVGTYVVRVAPPAGYAQCNSRPRKVVVSPHTTRRVEIFCSSTIG
jgi:hypothetical protein